MIINFMQYSPFPPPPLPLRGSVIERVVTYKLLGVYISDDLSWNVHIEHIVKKANKRLYALPALKKSGLTITQLVQVYCSIVRSVLEYACPVWAVTVARIRTLNIIVLYRSSYTVLVLC